MDGGDYNQIISGTTRYHSCNMGRDGVFLFRYERSQQADFLFGYILVIIFNRYYHKDTY